MRWEKKKKNSTFDKKFLDQVTCIDIFNCNWLWYLVDAVEMLLAVYNTGIIHRYRVTELSSQII